MAPLTFLLGPNHNQGLIGFACCNLANLGKLWSPSPICLYLQKPVLTM